MSRYRLGLDLGANSIGWCALALNDANEPCGLIDLGVRIHPDGRNPKDLASNAVARRQPRAMRRNRDRYLRRRKNLLNALTRFGLMPADPAERQAVAARDPYLLREAALLRPLAPDELGRVIFHLAQRRGFKSNRKTERADNDPGLIADATARTQAELARQGHATLGSWLAERHRRRAGVRVRLAGSGASAAYPFYPSRAMVEAEFDTIWTAQSAWNPALTAAMGVTLREIIFHQRPLKPVKVGKCLLEPTEDRAARGLPSTQRFRIAQTVAHLRFSLPGESERAPTAQERAVLAQILYRGSDLTPDRVRKKLGLPVETDLSTRDDILTGDTTAKLLGGKKGIGAAWHDLDLESQDRAAAAIIDAEDIETVTATLTDLGITADAAVRAAGCNLAEGHGALSTKAMRAILPHLEAGMTYSAAVQAAGYAHHSDFRTGEVRSELPYYGELLAARIGTGSGEPEDEPEKRYGKAPNPTVHVALNEVRRVVNAIIARLGPPEQIVVETLRDLGRTKKQREEHRATQKKNEATNKERVKTLTDLHLPDNGRNRMRLRLLEEQNPDPKQRVCPYSGTLITPAMALSDLVEEDHILPFSTTLDDGAANRVLVMREWNRRKANRDPFTAFGHTAEWPRILERVALLPPEKRWRFQPNALEKFATDGDFLARHLTDSATIARWAVMYLDVLAPGKVWAVPGRLTGLLRRALGLNARSILGRQSDGKDRTDHRHHGIDAVVVALTDRSLLNRVARAAKRAEAGAERLMERVEPPWDGFVADIKARMATVAVSRKPDTGWQAALHNDTAYGIIKDAGPKAPNVVVRKPLAALADWEEADILAGVRDPVLATRIADALRGKARTERAAALAALRHTNGSEIRSVRVVDRLNVFRPIRDRRTEREYKAVKLDKNHRAELWRLPDGKIKLTVISIFDAAQEAEAKRLGRKAPDLRPHPAAKLLLRLHKSDSVAFGLGEERTLMTLVKMSPGKLQFAALFEGGELRKRHFDRADPFEYVQTGASTLIETKARKVYVTPDGRIHDPGPLQ